MSKTLEVRNSQARFRIDCRLMRRILGVLMGELVPGRPFNLGVNIIDTEGMTRLNETFLRHAGSTDVLAFDYSEPGDTNSVVGELFLCADEALIQSRRYGTTWQGELVRYAVHGILHLLGYQDRTASLRRQMKREEDRLLRQVMGRFAIGKLGSIRDLRALRARLPRRGRVTVAPKRINKSW
ncbi:MAG TPA: rRNA maturation RNase YbeY [Verrucomicrobiae bacterium]|nr:rRNA maturation RNase YbeY [Verrucomicrobiae bacterium]